MGLRRRTTAQRLSGGLTRRLIASVLSVVLLLTCGFYRVT